MARPSPLIIGPLRGGGLVLGYACSSHCRHCLYGCGPHRHDGGTEEGGDIEEILDGLARRARRCQYHIGGGEPFLDVPLLERAVAGLGERGLSLDYVETNGSWAHDAEQAEALLEGLRRAGLRCLLVSLSPFHAEFIAPARTRTAIAAAERVLPGGAFVWIPEFAEDLGILEVNQRLDLDALLAARGDQYARALAGRYGLVPAGRAGRYLFQHGEQRPLAELLASAPCAHRLTDTTHFHIDLLGRYVPGLCPGIVLPLDEVPGSVDLELYPVLSALVGGGLAALVELARGEGFVPAPEYASSCDLCTAARCFLYQRVSCPELGPPGFYDSRSVEFAP